MLNPFLADEIQVTSPYGDRVDPHTNKIVFHPGLDIICSKTDDLVAVTTGIVASSTMVISKANRTWEWGNYIKISGSDGVDIYYCHLASRIIKVGAITVYGTPIGKEGNTGLVSGTGTGLNKGKHLHIEGRIGTKHINIAEYLGIPNKVGIYTDTSYPNDGLEKILYGIATKAKFSEVDSAVSAMKSFRHPYINEFWKKISDNMK